MPIDKLLVRGIRLEASIGILPWERETRQSIEVDVQAHVDTTRLLATGELARGVDFARLVEIVRETALAGHVELVETLADRIAAAILRETSAERVRVEVRKPRACAPVADHVGVEVERRRARRSAQRTARTR
jgi:dihydroneopterin aldolase